MSFHTEYSAPVALERLFAVYRRGEEQRTLSQLAIQLFEQQASSWPRLKAGVASLSSVRQRRVSCGGFEVTLQFNPGRIINTSAKVDAKSIGERRCFLCVDHLPPEQRGVLVDDEFLILCNPAPIFHQHFTISHVRHTPQNLEANIDGFLYLAERLGPHFTVFYNGPKCGASAPDHMHFQASPIGSIPVEQDAATGKYAEERGEIGGVRLSTMRKYGREVILLKSDDRTRLGDTLRGTVSAMREVLETKEEEPMMNVLCSFRDGCYRLILFPRRRHRPRVYFEEGEKKVLVSPAAVDIGGLVITPLEKDYLGIDGVLISEILREVTIEPEQTHRIVQIVLMSER